MDESAEKAPLTTKTVLASFASGDVPCHQQQQLFVIDGGKAHGGFHRKAGTVAASVHPLDVDHVLRVAHALDPLVHLTTSLGGTHVQKDFYLITRRELPKAAIDQEAIDAVTETLLATEQRLSSTSHDVLGRESAPEALRALEDGDLVAFVRERPGLLVHHAGFVYWANGTPRLLHASSYHERVVITESDLTDYLLRRPERKGVIIARPLAAQDVPGR